MKSSTLVANDDSGIFFKATGLSKDRLDRAIAYMDREMDKRLTPAMMASAAALSEFHFSREFKRTTSLTPMQFLWRRRVERSKSMMASMPAASLLSIALACGFTSHSHFVTVFKRHTSTTPSQYRSGIISPGIVRVCFACGGRVAFRMGVILAAARPLVEHVALAA